MLINKVNKNKNNTFNFLDSLLFFLFDIFFFICEKLTIVKKQKL